MKILKKIALLIIALLLYFVLALIVVLLFSLFTDFVFLPNDYLFYEHGQLSGTVMTYLLLIPPAIFCYTILKKLGILSPKTSDDEVIFIWNKLGRFKFAVIIAWIAALYCCFTNLTVVSEDCIKVHSPFNPTGTEFSYSEVEKIECGFGSKKIAICDYKEEGNFFYKISLDSEEIIFHQPTPNAGIKKYEEDSYSELEDFDNALTDLQIPKASNKNGYEKCYYDKEFVDRFLRIIENK